MKQERVAVQITGIRSLDRNVARNNMKKQGMSRINKKYGDKASYFSRNWRDYVKGVKYGKKSSTT